MYQCYKQAADGDKQHLPLLVCSWELFSWGCRRVCLHLDKYLFLDLDYFLIIFFQFFDEELEHVYNFLIILFHGLYVLK